MVQRSFSRPPRREQLAVDEVLTGLYQGLLSRDPDPSGIAAQGRLLRAENGLADVVKGIASSEERYDVVLQGDDLPMLAARVWKSRRANEVPLFHLHIAKTGGTALAYALRSIAGDRFCLTGVYLDHIVATPWAVLHNASLIEGHLGVEALDVMAPGTVTVTVIREPVARTLSHWNHVRADHGMAPGLSLEEFVHSPDWRSFSSNYQTRNLVQRVSVARAWRDFDPGQRLRESLPHMDADGIALPLQCLFEYLPMTPGPAGLGPTAVAALDEIEYVGVTEEMDDLFASVAMRWGVSDPPPVGRLNVSSARTAAQELPRGLRQAIIQANDADFELYERARERSGSLPDAASVRSVSVDAPIPDGETWGPGPLLPASPVSRRLPALFERVPRIAAPIAVAVGVSAVDAVLPQVTLAPLLVAAPLLAGLLVPPRRVIFVALVVLILMFPLGLVDGIADTVTQVWIIAAILVAGVVAAWFSHNRGGKPTVDRALTHATLGEP